MNVNEATTSFDHTYCNEFVDDDPSAPYAPGVGEVFLFSRDFYHTCDSVEQMYSTSALSVRSPSPDFFNVIDKLQEHFRIRNGDFSIHCVSHSWFGNTSLEEFASLMTEPQNRYENTPDEIETHDTESAIFVAGVSGVEPSRVVIHALTYSGSGRVSKFGVHFLMSGIPLDSGQYTHFADDSSLSFLPVKEFHTRTGIVPARDVYPFKRLGDERHVDSLWCPNPFYQNHPMREDYIPNIHHSISGIKWLFSELKHAHFWEDEKEYSVDTFRIDSPSGGLPMPFGLTNIFLFIDYV